MEGHRVEVELLVPVEGERRRHLQHEPAGRHQGPREAVQQHLRVGYMIGYIGYIVGMVLSKWQVAPI